MGSFERFFFPFPSRFSIKKKLYLDPDPDLFFLLSLLFLRHIQVNVLVVGSGGREHALSWKLGNSPRCGSLFCAPANAGIALEPAVTAVPSLDVADNGAVVSWCKEQGIGLVVVGPEQPLVDGLAAGKGVTVAFSVEEAHAAIDDALVARRFGDAGAEIVVEEFLEGEEASFFAIIDGETALPLASAQDHKAVGEGDTGPNTGGMGAYSPAPVVTPEIEEQVMETIVRRTAAAMADRGSPFTGVLFAGLMIKDGVATLLEHNVRFGDPECEALMLRLESDLLELLLAASEGKLSEASAPRWSDDASMTVVLAAEGYPGDYKKNTEIRGIKRAEAAGTEEAIKRGSKAETPAKVFHAGTSNSNQSDAGDDDLVLSSGGRVLAVTARAPGVAAAQAAAYAAVDQIDWPEGFCRRDIGWRAVGK